MPKYDSDYIGNALKTFAQDGGIPYKNLANGHKSMAGAVTLWQNHFQLKESLSLITEQYKHWQKSYKDIWIDIKRLFKEKRSTKRTPRRFWNYLLK